MDITSFVMGKKAGGGGTPTVLEEKQVTVTTNGETTITPSEGYDGISSVDLTTNVQPILESKSVTISTNTTTTIQPTQGKDGLSSVEVITAVPQPSGKINITQNGMDIDVSSYALADVSVTGQKYTPKILCFGNNNSSTTISDMTYEINNVDVSLLTSMLDMFDGFSNIVTLDLSTWENTNITNYSAAFRNCGNLETVDMSKLSVANDGSTQNMFFGCTKLSFLDMRLFMFTNLTNSLKYTNLFGNPDYNKGVPANCEIIVKDATQKQWIRNNFSWLTNVKTVAEYEGS